MSCLSSASCSGVLVALNLVSRSAFTIALQMPLTLHFMYFFRLFMQISSIFFADSGKMINFAP